METPKQKLVESILNAQAELNQALEELEKLPAFDAGVVGFAAHAISNYLTVTNATIDLLALSLETHPDDQIRKWLGGLHQATSLMGHAVSQLTNASAAGEPKFMYVSIDLVRLVHRACDYYQRVAECKQIELSFEHEAAAASVWTDGVAVAAVLDNLLSNAVKYSSPGASVRVAIIERPDFLICSVQDEGPGLSAAEQEELYQRGVRLSSIPTGGEASSGFGLAIAKELVEKLGGRIWCESQPGKGACFSFSLPTATAPSAA